LNARVLLTLASLIAISAAGFAALALLLDLAADDGPPAGQTAPANASVRIVCSLLTGDARRAKVDGLDGGASVVAHGRTFWLFGDTFLSEGGGFVHAAIAVSDDVDGEDCVSMQFKVADGRAAALFPRLEEETTAWPEGALAAELPYVDFYYSSVVRDSPTAWRVVGVGGGRFNSSTMDGARGAVLWDAASRFGDTVLGARSPTRVGPHVYVFLFTDTNRHLLARAPADALAERAAYEYWDGDGFSRDPGDAVTLWPVPPGPVPAHNGLSVKFNARLGKWIAIYNAYYRSVRVRMADDLRGPWTDELTLFDCGDHFDSPWPTCYSAEQHPELASGDHGALYITVGTSEPYDVWLLEVDLPEAIK
jgi:hypothetical protein